MSELFFLESLNLMCMSVMSVDDLYYHLIETMPGFKKMSMDEQGETVVEIKLKLEKM